MLRRLISCFATLALIAVVALVIRIQGSVRGTEFSPTHFQQRAFRFYEIPLIHLQITPIRRAGVTPKTARYVRQKSLIVPHTGPPTTWHLVSISRGLSGTTAADANLLIDQLNLVSGGDPYWQKWSVDHPKHAGVFWPIIQNLAQRELYVLMPALFELAQMDCSPSQLRAEIDAHLRRAYCTLVRDLRAADRHQLAQQLLDEATVDYPDDPELLNLRRNPTEDQ